MTNEPWAYVADVPRHLGVAKYSVYRWVESRNQPANRIDRLWEFKVSDIDDWVRAGGGDAYEVGYKAVGR